MNSLVDLGMIEKDQRKSPEKGKFSSNIYRVLTDLIGVYVSGKDTILGELACPKENTDTDTPKPCPENTDTEPCPENPYTENQDTKYCKEFVKYCKDYTYLLSKYCKEKKLTKKDFEGVSEEEVFRIFGEEFERIQKENEALKNQISGSEEKEPDTTPVVDSVKAYEGFLQLYQTVFPDVKNTMSLEKLWMGIPDAGLILIRDHLPKYLRSNEPRYLKTPKSYLKAQEYENPVIDRREKKHIGFSSPEKKNQVSNFLSKLSNEKPRAYTGT